MRFGVRNTRVTTGKPLFYCDLVFSIKVLERVSAVRRPGAVKVGGGGREPFGLLAERLVDGTLDLVPGSVGDGAYRTQGIAVQIARRGDGGAVDQPHGGMRVGDHLLLPGDQPVADLHCAEIHRRRGRGRDRGAVRRRREVLDQFPPGTIDAVDVAGAHAVESHRKRPVLAIVGHGATAETGRHVAVGPDERNHRLRLK